MKKYIVLFLLCGFFGNAQYNLFARQNFAYKTVAIGTNTEIGGVASTISTPALLATKLGISVGAISNFSVVGSDIQCHITGSYAIPASAFNSTLPCTYYIDSDKLVNYIYISAFQNTSVGGVANFENALTVESDALRVTNFTKFLLKNATTIGNNCFLASNKSDVFYIPSCTTLGSSTGNNAVFDNIKSGAVIYTNSYLATNNAGAPDGDLINAISQGVTVRYVTNFTSPSAVSDLATGTIYNTAVQLTFTPPSTTNAIDYYEAYVNGIFNKKITASGQFIYELTDSTSYTITLIAVDIFYNKSVVSNSLSISTTNRSAVDADAIAYVTASSNTAYQDIVDDMFVNLKSNSLYTKIQAFYPFLGTTATQHKWNGKNPLDTDGANRLVFTGSGTFSNNGYLTNGTGTYANTFLIPNTSQSLNNNGMTITVGENDNTTSGNDFIMGVYQSGTQMSLLANKNNNTTFSKIIRLNGNAISVNNGNTPLGVFTGTKQSSTVTKLFRNGVSQVSGNSGGTLPTIPIWIGDNDSNGSSYSNIKARIQFTAIHEGLSDAEVATLHIIIDTFETALGRKTW